jgi:uncharacterized protein
MVKSRIYIAAGFVCIGLGVLGIPLPVLPTTPFLLLAAYFFARGSQRWHSWLMNHPTLSPFIIAFRDKHGLPRQQKRRIGALITIPLLFTVVFAQSWYGKGLAGFIWFTTMLFLYFTPRAHRSSSEGKKYAD